MKALEDEEEEVEEEEEGGFSSGIEFSDSGELMDGDGRGGGEFSSGNDEICWFDWVSCGAAAIVQMAGKHRAGITPGNTSPWTSFWW